jgi:hypothetical protein
MQRAVVDHEGESDEDRAVDQQQAYTHFIANVRIMHSTHLTDSAQSEPFLALRS